MNSIEVVLFLTFEDDAITGLKKHVYRFPVGHDIRIDLTNLVYQYTPNPTATSNVPWTNIEFNYAYPVPGFPMTARLNPGQRLTLNLDLTLESPDLTIEPPIVTMEPFLPLYTETGFAYFGTLVVLPSEIPLSNTYSSDMAALRLQYERRTGIDLDVQYDANGTYITPVDDGETLTTVIATKNAEINFFTDRVVLVINNPTDIVHFFAPTKTYIVSNQFLFTSPVYYIFPTNEARMYDDLINEDLLYLTIPLTEEEFDVNFITNTVNPTSNKLFEKIDLNSSVAHVTMRDGSVKHVKAYNTTVYGYVVLEKSLIVVIGYSYFSKIGALDKNPRIAPPESPEPEADANPDPEVTFDSFPDQPPPALPSSKPKWFLPVVIVVPTVVIIAIFVGIFLYYRRRRAAKKLYNYKQIK